MIGIYARSIPGKGFSGFLHKVPLVNLLSVNSRCGNGGLYGSQLETSITGVKKMKSDTLADRIFDLIMEHDYYNAMDNGVTHEQVKSLLVNDPESVIEILVDFIEEV